MSDLRTRIRSTLDDALDEGWNEDAWTDAVLAVFAAWLRERAERADKGVELCPRRLASVRGDTDKATRREARRGTRSRPHVVASPVRTSGAGRPHGRGQSGQLGNP